MNKISGLFRHLRTNSKEKVPVLEPSTSQSPSTRQSTRQSLYTHKELPENTKCIRLLVLRPGTWTDNLHLELCDGLRHLDAADPGNDSPYEALSYAWGSKDDLVAIDFGPNREQMFMITQNLSVALRHLRYAGRPRTMWIDAICIDQENLAERSAQVVFMDEIFKAASGVIAWLGPEEDNSTRALELLQNIGEQVDIDWNNRNMFPAKDASDPTLGNRQSPLPISNTDATILRHLVARQWFRRLWVRQEVVFARAGYFQAGLKRVPLDTFRRAVACLYFKTPNKLLSRGYVQIVYDVCRPSPRYKLQRLSRHIQGGACEDPRDRVFSILKLLSNTKESLLITPDYSATTAEVYQRVVLEDINFQEDLDILSDAELGSKAPRLPDLPTWVPDWSTDRFSNKSLADCLGGSGFQPIFNHDGGNVLTVAGVECATITNKIGIEAKSVMEVLVALQEIEPSWVSTDIVERRYITGETRLEALSRTLMGNCQSDHYRPPRSHYPKVAEVQSAFLEMIKGWYDLPKAVDPRIGSVVRTENGNRCIFTTNDGHIGTGPRASRSGDRVVLLLGSRMPLVLRPVGDDNDSYQVVGECYMHGIMTAEPLLGPLPENWRYLLHLRNGKHADTFTTPEHNEPVLEDPRMASLGVNLENYRARWEQGKLTSGVRAKPEDFKRIGVTIKDFNLI